VRSIVINLSVCLSVCEHISGTTGAIFTKFCVQIPCGHGSVLLWWRCDMLCTSGFMDDVTLGCSGPHSDSDIATPGWSLMCVNALFVKDLRCHFCNDVKWCVYW